MPDPQLKLDCELLILLQELHTRKLLDRDQLDLKINALKKDIALQINSEQ